jgi:hypothetical protein
MVRHAVVATAVRELIVSLWNMRSHKRRVSGALIARWDDDGIRAMPDRADRICSGTTADGAAAPGAARPTGLLRAGPAAEADTPIRP